jgi:hypothetical protein
MGGNDFVKDFAQLKCSVENSEIAYKAEIGTAK